MLAVFYVLNHGDKTLSQKSFLFMWNLVEDKHIVHVLIQNYNYENSKKEKQKMFLEDVAKRDELIFGVKFPAEPTCELR